VAVGLQPSFSWSSVAASAVSAGVGYGMSKGLDNSGFNDTFGSAAKLTRASMSGFAAGMTVNAMRGGQQTAIQVATDAFGNALASDMADSMAKAGTQTSKVAANEPPRIENDTIVSDKPWPKIKFAALPAAPANWTPDTSPNTSDELLNDLGLKTAKGNGGDAPILLAAGKGFTLGGGSFNQTVAFDAMGNSTGYTDVSDPEVSTNDKTSTGPNRPRDKIDDYIDEAKMNGVLPSTGTLNAQEKAELYHRMLTSSTGNDNTLADLADGKKVIFGLRKETDINTNGGKGAYDDRVVIMSLDSDGKPQLHYEGNYNTEPIGRYQGREGKDINYDGIKDLGRLPGNKVYGYEFANRPQFGPNIDGSDYNILKGVKSVDLERLANGKWESVGNPGVGPDKNFSDGRTVYFHQGSTNSTDSAGCQTVPKADFSNFMKALNPNGPQKAFNYYLKTM
jgi:hypothetical protein